MNKKVYVLSSGRYYNDYCAVVAVARTKKEAAQLCRAEGYRWSSEDQLFCNEDRQGWIRVDSMREGCIDSGRRVRYGLTKEQRQEDEQCLEHHGFKRYR